MDKAIHLRWVLRDIKGKRLKLSLVASDDLRTLVDMGYVEIVNGDPIVSAIALAISDCCRD